MLRRLLLEKPIEMLASVAMVIAGVYLATSGGSVALSTIGSVLAGLAGILASWSSAVVSQQSRAAEILRPQLSSVGRQLATISSQLGKAISAVHSRQISPNTAYALILQANNNLYTLLSELQHVAGAELDTQQLFETVEQLDELAERLDRLPPHEVAQDDVQAQELALLREDIRHIRSSVRFQSRSATSATAAHRPTVIESSPCPYCGKATRWPMAPGAGESAAPTCHWCNKRFFAHRGPDGRFIFRSAEGHEIAGGAPAPYESILRRHGVRPLPPSLVMRACQELATIFNAEAVATMASWQDVDQALIRAMLWADGPEAAAHARKLRQLLFKARVFDVTFDPFSFKLAISNPDHCHQAILQMMALRIQSAETQSGRTVDIKQLANLLYGNDDPSGTTKARALLTSISEPNQI